MTRRTLALLFVCTLLLGLLTASLAENQPPALDLGYHSREYNLYDAATVFDGHVILSGRELSTWQEGDDQVRLLAKLEDVCQRSQVINPGRLLVTAGADGLYALDIDGGRLFSLDISGEPQLHHLVDLDTSLLLEGTHVADGVSMTYIPRQLLVNQGRLYILDMPRSAAEAQLYSFDLQTGGAPRLRPGC